MTTKHSSDDVMDALVALKPDAGELDHAWYIGRRENNVQAVLTRAAAPTTASAPVSRSPKPRRTRRIVIGGLAVAVFGGGVAWAALSNFTAWHTGGALDGLTCVTTWHVPDGDQRDDQYGGSLITDDPIADCHTYAELTGKPRIVDPVATTYRDSLVVGPREGMPADAIPVTNMIDPAVRELEQSLEDYVDGGRSRCFDTASGEQFVRDELARLGLSGWTIVTAEQEAPEGPCAGLFVSEPGEVHVRGHSAEEPRDRELVNTLRREIADQCRGLAEAESMVEQILTDEQHYQPTSSRVDAEAQCTRVDLVMGGSLQVFLYGPETVDR